MIDGWFDSRLGGALPWPDGRYAPLGAEGRQAALTGYSLGQYHYGLALLNGHGVDRDLDLGRYWLERAAAGGDQSAAALLRTM